MALLDAYATAANYRAAVKGSDTTDDAIILDRLKAAARLIDLETGGYPGRFNQTAADVVRYFDGNGEAELEIDEFTTLAGLAVDTGVDGTYGQSVTLTNVSALPHNAAEFSDPYRRLWLEPYSANTELSAFTKGRKTVKVIATWGWPAVPTLIRDLNIGLAHDLWDLMRSGSTLTLANIDVGVRLSPETNSMLQRARNAYRRLVLV